jgi:Rrf2 family transcriptional regulator, cysteine metabolism repressor
LIEFSGNYDGRSGRRMKEIWGDIRITLDEKAKSYTLDTLVAKDDAEMYHI